jgi:hypothetical protein
MDTLKVPMQFINGSALTWTEDTDEYFAHLLFCFTSTQRGELILRPQIGVGDIAFDINSIQTLAYNVAQYILEAYTSDNGETDITISFLKRENDDIT